MHLIRGVSDELARGCKHWHPLAPGSRYGKKKSSLWDMSLHLSLKQQQTVGPLKNKMSDIYKKVFRSSLSLIMFPLVFVWRQYNICINLTPPLWVGSDTRSIFKEGNILFEFKVFLFNWFAFPRLKNSIGPSP